MKRLRVNIPKHEYDICIGHGVFQNSGEFVSKVFKGKKIAVVTDENVKELYAETFLLSLERKGYKTTLITIPAGEKSKSLDMLEKLYEKMLDFKITRTDLIVALGGGVVGDLTGYAAASLLRGIPFIQVPTTLLAQVDSSVGGKVAVNLKQGKNLVGAFYQPKMVLIDPECLSTLDDRIFADGMAEVIKYGAIWDENLFRLLENFSSKQELLTKIDDIIYKCCDIKRQVVEDDEFDTGRRMILNFGHTFGHAIEKHYNYETYTHGEAVAVGMIMASEFSEKSGLCGFGVSDRIKSILEKYNLPTRVEIENSSIVDAVAVDKKGEGNIINLILLKQIGKAIIKKIEKSEIIE